MNTLVINAGSVTIKYKVFDGSDEVLLTGKIDNLDGKYVSELSKAGSEYSWQITPLEFKHAASLIVAETKAYQIEQIAFRIVHGGEMFSKPTLLTDETIGKLEKLSSLAPLHNPVVISHIKDFKALLPSVPLYGVFDTAYYSNLEPKAFMYGLPYEYYTHYQVRKYGFHGISHKYLVSELQKLESKAEKVITCHLGGGASITASLNGKSIDTSMGFTPLEGLIMATRAGDVDDGAIKFIQEKTAFSDQEMEDIENLKSGLLGISGYTADMRVLLSDAKAGNERAKLAIDMYVYRIQKYIGSFASSLNGVDALVISGGVGAGSDVIREAIVANLGYLNLSVATEVNNGKINVASNLKISSPGSKPIWVIPTNEELQIERELKTAYER